jgi:hypothetical protein
VHEKIDDHEYGDRDTEYPAHKIFAHDDSPNPGVASRHPDGAAIAVSAMPLRD